MGPNGYAKDALDCVDLAKRVRGQTAGTGGTRRALHQLRNRESFGHQVPRRRSSIAMRPLLPSAVTIVDGGISTTAEVLASKLAISSAAIAALANVDHPGLLDFVRPAS